MARLFIACDLPPLVKQKLDRMSWGIQGAKWVMPDSHHLTLCFLGEAAPPQISDVIAALAPIKCPQFTLNFEALGTFGDKKPRNLHIKTDVPDPLKVLQRSISHAMRNLGFELEHRKFKPHVTLARLKNNEPAQIASYLEMMGTLDLPPLEINGFTLFQSHRAHSGAQYEELCTFGGDNDIVNGSAGHSDYRTGPYLAVDNSPSTASSSISRT